jgi:hypothetical protein
MVTFANAVNLDDERWCVLIRIEGVGDSVGWWAFCNQAPAYADSTYKPWLSEWPEVLSERADIIGGVPESGAFTASIVDTALSCPFAPPLFPSVVTAGVSTASIGVSSASTSTIDVQSGASIATHSVFYVGNEAIFVTAGGGTTSLSVERGMFGTDQLAHNQGDPVVPALPYLRSRRAYLYLVPVDADSVAEETLFATIFLDRLAFDETTNVFHLSGKSGLKWLSRLVPKQPAAFKINQVQPSSGIGQNVVSYVPIQPRYQSINVLPWDPNSCYAKLGDKEIVKLTSPDSSSQVGSLRVVMFTRGQLNTPQEDYSSGSQLTAIFAADTVTPGAPAAFRWNPGPQYGGTISTSRSSGTWNITAHPIDIMLCLLTSSYDVADLYEVNNYDPNYGNWSVLPAGFGAGIPMAQINLLSFLAIRDRMPYWAIPLFYYGHTSEPLSDLLTREILRPFGMYLTMNAGQLTCACPRIVAHGVPVAATIDQTNLYVDKRGENQYLPRLQLEYSGDNQVSAFVFKTRGTDGSEVTTTVTNADFAGLYGQVGYYAVDEKPIEIELAGRADGGRDFMNMIYDLAQARLYRYQKPSFKLTVETNISLYALVPGSPVAVTLNELPNFTTGLRGWTLKTGEVLERSVIVDENGGARMRLVLLIYADISAGIIAPAASVVSVTGAGPYTVTVVPNRYTDPHNVAGYPTNDALAFALNDVVQLYNLDGSSAAAGSQTVSANPTTSTLQLNGNFGGALAAGLILRYASRGPSSDLADATQAASFVYSASDVNLQIGASNQHAWQWAEQ